MAQFEDLTLDVGGLATLRDLNNTWEVDQVKVDDLAREELDNDRLSADLLVGAAHPLRVDLYFIPGQLEVGVLLAGLMAELNPVTGRSWRVRQLNYRGSSSHNIRSSGQEIAAADALEDAGLATRLTADHYDRRHLY